MNLHILLKSEHALFSFKEDDFQTFRNTHPSVDLNFIESEADLISQLSEIEYLDTWHFESHWYEKAPKLKHLFTPAAGREYVATNPLVDVHFGTFHGELMAETTLGLIMQSSLRLPEYRNQQINRRWQRLPLRLIRNQSAMILGYGSIGRVCGALLSANGMQVIGASRQPVYTDENGLDENGVRVVSTDAIEDWLPKMDHVISFLPDNTSTKHFIDHDRLSLFSPNAYFYNLGRGSTVDEPALIAALQNGKLAGAALDVTEMEPLPRNSDIWENQKITLLPHASAYYEEYRAAHVTEVTDLLSGLNRPSTNK